MLACDDAFVSLSRRLQKHELGGLFWGNPVSSPSANAIVSGRAIAKSTPMALNLTPRRGESLAMLAPFTKSDDVTKYNPLYKTNFCREFTLTGSCPFQEKCHFAHGEEELRPLPPQAHVPPTNLPLSTTNKAYTLSEHVYKTELCTVFIKDGSCRYGIRCHFA
jgi:hypothetical protein